MKKDLAICICFTFLIGCIPMPPIACYRFSLLEPIENVESNYEDNFIKVNFFYFINHLKLKLQNKTNHSIKILWDESAYVDHAGGSHRVIHDGVRYADRDKSQIPTVVPKGAYITDFIHPVEYIYFCSEGWKFKPLLLTGKEAESLKDATFRVMLSIEIDGKRKVYEFKFKIKDIKYY